MHVEESGSQVEGLYKNEKKMTPFLQKRVEKMNVLTKKNEKKKENSMTRAIWKSTFLEKQKPIQDID